MLLILALIGLSILRESQAQFSKAIQQKILDNHNWYRAQVALGQFTAKNETKMPAAADMMKMVWDDKLAEAAQKWAETMSKKHSPNRHGAGENMYFMWSSGNVNLDKQADNAVFAWMNEFKKFEFTSNEMKSGTGTGHATQVSWAKSSKLGCGAFKYNNNHNVGVVCQYAPAGNIIGRKIYEYGATCSKCPAGTKCEIGSGLCA